MIDIMSLLMGICGPLFFFVEDSLTHPASSVETEELSRRLRSYGVSQIRSVTKHVHHHVSLRKMIHTKRYVKWNYKNLTNRLWGIKDRCLETRSEGEEDGCDTSWVTLEGELLGSHLPPHVTIDSRT